MMLVERIVTPIVSLNSYGLGSGRGAFLYLLGGILTEVAILERGMAWETFKILLSPME